MSEQTWRKLQEELHLGTPRALRARRFADTVFSLMRDFIPRDRECVDRIREELMIAGYEANAEIINVPPEWDALTKEQIERAKLETHPMMIEAAKSSPFKL